MKIRDRRRTPSAPTTHRVATVPDGMLAPYLDTSVMSFGQALDAWRFQNGSRSDVDTALDAINALWLEIERRGLGRD